MARIEVYGEEEPEGWRFNVTVAEGESSSSHEVTLADEARDRLAGPDADPEELVEESFRFLLEREPKEQILPSFDLPEIGRYFPEYEEEIGSRIL